MARTNRKGPADSGKGGRADRGKGQGGSGGGASSREVTISKAMSYVLRHAADKEGLKLDSNGYARVNELLEWHKLKRLNVSFGDIKDIVRTNEKQRFALVPDPAFTPETSSAAGAEVAEAGHAQDETDAQEDEDPSKYLIRATQGHSIAIDNSNLLTPMTLETAPAIVVHGTYAQAWPLILKSGGLKRMSRTLIHFAPAVLPGFTPLPSSSGSSSQKASQQAQQPPQPAETPSSLLDAQPQASGEEPKVISGMRKSADVHIYVDVHRSIRDGNAQWWRSENNVFLTEGEPDKGLLPTTFFVKAVHQRTGKVLWEDGKAVD